MEAVETLSKIAEYEIDAPFAAIDWKSERPAVAPLQKFHIQNAARVMSGAKDAFRVILNYLKNYYRREYGKLVRHESIEGIKDVMKVAVGAFNKLDTFAHLFPDYIHSEKDTKEFQALDSFYQKKIAPIEVQESLGKWLHDLPIIAVLGHAKQRKEAEVLAEERFIEMEAVKKDTEYELFFVRKEDGSRFFTSRTLRDVMLLGKTEDIFDVQRSQSLHLELAHLQDTAVREKAQNIFKTCATELGVVVNIAKKYPFSEPLSLLYKAIIALFLAAQTKPKIVVKSADVYLSDCIRFLRNLVDSTDYKKMLAYYPSADSEITTAIIKAVQGLSNALFVTSGVPTCLNDYIAPLCGKEPGEIYFSDRIGTGYKEMQKIMHQFAFLPSTSVLHALQDGDVHGFDPLLLHNMPGVLFNIPVHGKNVTFYRIPTPTYQEYIHGAYITEEWKNFLRTAIQHKKDYCHIIFNFQNRTSWRDFARVKALEELQNQAPFASHVHVITLAHNGDFYEQNGPYLHQNHSGIFIEHLLEHLDSEASGFAYPKRIKTTILAKLARTLSQDILKVFFSNKNVLTRNDRLNFIELLYIMLEAAIINYMKADAVSYTCKDGLDSSLPEACLMAYFLNTIQEGHITPYDESYMQSILYGLPLLVRGRTLFEERFTRMQSAMKAIETVLPQQGKDLILKDIFP